MSAALHPVVRRRLTPAAPPAQAHETILRPLGGGATILSAIEQDFIGAVLADLESDTWRDAIARRAGTERAPSGRYLFGRRGSDGMLELSPPTHKRFHLVVLEACCHAPGSPRIDPRALAGMGFVLRRRDRTDWQGWMKAGPVRHGWKRLDDVGADPDPLLRRPARTGAAGALEALIAKRRGSAPQLAEEVHPLFLAPPALCARLGRTILYGLVPTASSEMSEVPTPPLDYAAIEDVAERNAIRDHLSSYLKARAQTAMPQQGNQLLPQWNALDSDDLQLKAFAIFLYQLAVELGAFEPTPSAQALMTRLSRIRLPLERDAQGRIVRDVAASEFLATARDVLIDRNANAYATMPLYWPAISAADGAALTDAALACLSARFAQVVPNAPKFEGDSERYAIRAFVRVRGHAECPPKLVWSAWSETFRILPWWASDAPPIRVSLPDVFDPQVLKNLKPGVSFALPPKLAKLLEGDAKKLRDGDGNAEGGLDIAWLCSFSIPIITLCAFIVLNIFLKLFDLIFQWMLYLKICIPIPKRRGP